MELAFPSGRKYKLDNPDSVTQADIDQIAAYDASLDGDTGSLATTAADVGIGVGGAIAGQVAGGAVGSIVPVVGTMAGAVVGGGIGGAMANIAVQKRRIKRGEQEGFEWGQFTAETGLSMIPGGKAAKVGGSVAKNAGRRAAHGAGLASAGITVQAAIDEGRLPTLPEYLVAMGTGSLIGGGLGAAEQKLINNNNGNWINEVTLGPMAKVLKKVEGDEAAMAEITDDAANIIAKEVRKAPKESRDVLQQRMHNYLGGKGDGSDLPESAKNAVKNARDAIDAGSDELVIRGVVTGKLADTVVSNKGSYLRRSYNVFKHGWEPDPDVFKRWVNKQVDDELAERVVASRNKQASSIVDGVGDAREALDSPVFTKADRDQLVTHFTKVATNLVYRDPKHGAVNAHEFIMSGSLKMETGIFKPRKDLDKLTMELLGVIKDPVLEVRETGRRIARAAAVFQGKKEMAEIGLKTGLFVKDPPLDQAAAGWWMQIAPDDAKFNPHAGLYTHPEIKNALESIHTSDMGKLASGWLAVSSWAKMPLTLGNLKAHASNWWAAPMDIIAQGHGLELLRSGNWRDTKRIAGHYLGLTDSSGNLDNKLSHDMYRAMIREGLVTKSVTFADFQYSFDASKSGGIGLFKNEGAQKAAELLKRGVDKLGRVFSFPESMGKVFNLAGELRTLREAYPDAKFEQLFKEAASIVKGTTTNYNALWGGLKKLSGFGFLQPFVLFVADRFRITYNTYAIGLRELSSKNPVIRKRGATRLASTSLVLGAAGVAGYNKHLSKEEDAALRRRLPEWDTNGFLAVSERDGDSYAYTNLNYTIPQTIAIEAAAAAMRGDDPTQSFDKFTDVILGQFFGASLLYRPIATAIRGETEFGTKVRIDADSVPKQIADTGLHLLGDMFVQGAAREVGKAVEHTLMDRPKVGTSGLEYNLQDAIKSNFMGLRTQRVNLPQSFERGARTITKLLNEIQQPLSRARRFAVIQRDVDAAFEELLPRHQIVFNRATELVADARTLGFKDEQIATFLKNGGMPSTLSLGALRGVYVPPEKELGTSPREVYEAMAEGKTISQQMSAVSEMASTDPQMARSIADMVKQSARSEAKGISEVDALYFRLSATNGQRLEFIKQELQQLPEGPLRDIRLAELRKKGIITPLMNHLMKAGNN